VLLNDAAFRVQHERSRKRGDATIVHSNIVGGQSDRIVDAEFFNKILDGILIVVVHDQARIWSRSLYLFCSSTRSGISARQGPHQVAQKFKRITFPRESASVTGLPSRPLSLNSGADRGAHKTDRALLVGLLSTTENGNKTKK